MPVQVICEICDKPFLVPPSRLKKGKVRYCSHACTGASKRIPVAERLWAKVDFNGPLPEQCPELGHCWLWAGMVNEHGYGRIWDESQPNYPFIYVHRLSYQLVNGPLEEGDDVLHHCDRPNCLRPNHLYKGDQVQNNADRDERDRVRHGEVHPNAKLSQESVHIVRKLIDLGKISQEQIGAIFGVSHSTISDIKLGKTRKRD